MGSFEESATARIHALSEERDFARQQLTLANQALADKNRQLEEGKRKLLTADSQSMSMLTDAKRRELAYQQEL
jgi:hypothetical protein